MLRVGLTGGAASGKSAAAAMLRDLGAAVSQSDEVARAMMQPGKPVFTRIVEKFGPEVVDRSGSLNRGVLAQLAFMEGRAEELNAIVHPPVIRAQAAWLAEVAAQDPDAVAVVESALLFETVHGETIHSETAYNDGGGLPWCSRFDRIVLVTAPEPIRLMRYIERAAASDPLADRERLRRDALSRFRRQLPEERKMELADFTIRNEGSLDHLKDAVAEVYRVLKHEAAGGRS